MNPARESIVGDYDIDYYWSLDQSEYATDVMFKSPAALAAVYPSLVRQGIETFHSADVMRFLGRRVEKGITPRQLQWWDERGVVKPQREGHRRLYSMNDLTEVAVICELRRKGFSLQGVRKVMRFLEREIGKGFAEIVSRNSECHLLTDGKHLYLETSARQIVDILKNSDQPILGVCLSDAVRQVRAGVVSGKANTSVTSPDYRRRAKKVS